ncbi:BatA domain-containing protein [Maribellus maritimus]|uniref:BatA domain-containing protein n=1 Tax=Maribellus maritimus TaxID=2870838 RepID=UPI001EECC7B2|nr:BatA domain-containing protein [Maribellus maritimus]MCG6187688.1 BatA domain-containing protein [Maribellus maritimus]
MNFLFPTFLFSLLAVAIPIIIHLFSFRRYKTVYFSNVGFLKNVKKESQKKSKIKQLLILLARILTIVFLVFAFAQPYIPNNQEVKRQTSQLVAVYVDNSFSMNALSEQGQLLEVARNKALEIVLAYPPGTKFRLFTNDLEPKHQHIFNREQFIREVSGIHSSPNLVPLSQIYNRFSNQSQDDNENSDKNLYFISDFQRSITDVENFRDENIFSYFLPLVPNEVANLYIDSCWVEIPAHRLNQEETIYVKIKNSSNQDYQNLPLRIFLNDSVKSITNFSVAAQNEITTSLIFTNNSAGAQRGKVEITDYPFTYDNNWFLSYYVEPELKALAIYSDDIKSQEGLNYITALFNDDDYVQLDEMNVQNMQMSRLPEYNAIFLINLDNFTSGFMNELTTVTRNGVSVVLFPGLDALNTNNDLLSRFNSKLITGKDTTTQKISGIDFDNKFYENVFQKREENAIFPEIDGHLKFEENIRSAATRLLWFPNGDNALFSEPVENGKLWVFGFPLNSLNDAFARDALFVPTIYNIVLNSMPDQAISYTIGENNSYNIPRNKKIDLNSTIEIENRDSGEKFIPEKKVTSVGTRIDFNDLISNAGHYLIQNDGETISTIAFNYNRNESDLRYFTPNELENLSETSGLNTSVVKDVTSNFSDIFDEVQNGKQLWKWCILLALFFIAAEILIIRFWK